MTVPARDDHGEPAKSSMVERVRTQVTERVEQIHVEAQERLPQSELVVEIGRRWIATNGAVLAGHLAYRVFLFLVPMVLLATAGLAWVGDGVDVESEASDTFGLSKSLASTIADASSQANETRAQLSTAAIVALLIAAWGLLGAFRQVFAFIWGVPAKSDRSVVNLLVRFMGAVLLFLVLNAGRQALTASGPIVSIAGLAVAIALNTALMLGWSWLLPRRPTTLIDLLPGSLVTGVALTLLTVGGSWYFASKLERASELYGVVGIVVVVLGFLFFTGQAVVLGAVTNTVWADRDEILAGLHPRET